METTTHPLQPFCDLYTFNNQLLATVSGGFEEADWVYTAGEGGNTAHWILGHVTAARLFIALRFGLVQAAEPWQDAFDMGVTPADPSTYPSVDELMKKFKEAGATLTTGIPAASAETLATKLDDPLLDGATDLEGLVRFFYMHETYHLGQISLIRRQRGHAAFA